MNLLLRLSLLTWLLGSATFGGPNVEESEIGFQIVNAGLTVDGTLTGLEADIQLDPAHPEQAHIGARVPVSTIQTGISLRDKHLQKPDYFDAEKFPYITLQSTSIRKTGRNRYEGLFALTMKGVTHEVKLPFTVSATNEFMGTLHLNRLDFNLGKPSSILANDVAIAIRVKLAKGT